MAVSEDYRAMTGDAIFQVDGGAVKVYADERVDANLLTAALRCVTYLSDVLDAVTGARKDDREAYMSDIVTLYLAARIHGVSAAGIYLVTLGLGKEAIHMERSQYEFFFKLFYYDHRKDKAAEFVESIPRSAREFADRAKYACTQISGEDLEAYDSLPHSEADFRSIRDELLRDTRFNRNFKNPIVEHLLRNSLPNLRDHWLWASCVAHASNLDLNHVVVVRDENTMFLNVDSRHKYPNRAIADFAQRCYITGIFVSGKFGIEVTDATVTIGQGLKEFADKHMDEPTSVRGLFDDPAQ